MSKGDFNPLEKKLTARSTDNLFDLVIEPPIAVEIEDLDERLDRLAHVVADKVIPRLLDLHNEKMCVSHHGALHLGSEEVAELSRLVIGPDNADAADYMFMLKDRGVSIDTLHVELLEPTARHLGDLWTEEKLDFLDVTIGVRRLQQLVHVFAGLDKVPQYDDKRRALIVSTPGEQHSFGNVMVQRFFRSGGWYVYSSPAAGLQEITALVKNEWFGIVGFSLSTDKHIDSLRSSIKAVRDMSLNKTIGIMVGGPAFAARPDLVLDVGADGTAANAPAAVILAKKLLVPSLLAVN